MLQMDSAIGAMTNSMKPTSALLRSVTRTGGWRHDSRRLGRTCRSPYLTQEPGPRPPVMSPLLALCTHGFWNTPKGCSNSSGPGCKSGAARPNLASEIRVQWSKSLLDPRQTPWWAVPHGVCMAHGRVSCINLLFNSGI